MAKPATWKELESVSSSQPSPHIRPAIRRCQSYLQSLLAQEPFAPQWHPEARHSSTGGDPTAASRPASLSASAASSSS